MCDTLVALPPATAGGVIFGKNSDRERNEAQATELHPAAGHKRGTELQVTRIKIQQARQTHAVLIGRPCWMWGAEMGANEAGVVIGNEAVHSTIPPNREPALLGMDLLRLGLERGGSAAEACDVIKKLLAEHGQGGDCGHTHPHFYHNSFIIADAAEAFVLETVGRDTAIERAHNVRTISNAYTLPAMRAHADPALEAPGDGPARCARSTALLNANWGKIDVLTAMATLRDHGPHAGKNWHPQDTVGRTICMHAGAGDRRGQSVASMVSELRPEGAIHWLTGTSAPCTSIFKPFSFASGLPPVGPAPTERADTKNLWWRHETLHRTLLGNASYLPDWLTTEREKIEADFFAATRAGLDAALAAQCWAAADELEARWQSRLGAPEYATKKPFAETWSVMGRVG